MTDKEFLEKEIMKWKTSPHRIMQIKGSLYYDNEHDILKRKRTMIGEDGKLQVVENLPNNRVIDNQYAKMVNQKANYLPAFMVERAGGKINYTMLRLLLGAALCVLMLIWFKLIVTEPYAFMSF